MDKVLEFLEKNIEWLALGLGGLFLLWVLWAYVLTPPVQVQIGSSEVSLKDVDRHIRDTAARELQFRIEDPRKAEIVFERLDQRWSELMANAGKQAPLFPQAQLMLPPVDMTIIQDTRDSRPDQVFVEALPKLPAPVFATKVIDGEPTSEHAIAKGRSLVLIPEVAPPQLILDSRGQRSSQPRIPNIDPRNFNPNNPNQNVQQIDRLWVSALATIPGKPVGEAFQNSNIFQVAPNATTIFLRVEVQREEQLPDGTWGNPTMVPELAINPLPPFPEDTEDRAAAFAYADWATQNAVLILKPPFYPVFKGDMWRKPGEPEPVLPSPEEVRRQQLLEQQQQDRLDREQRRPQRRQTQPRSSRRTRDNADYSPRDTDRPASSLDDGSVRFYQVQWRDPDMDPAYDPDYDPGYDPGYQPRGVQQSGQVAAELPPLVTAKFQPDANMPDVEIWFHDDTVESGKTYRYRVRYKMLNPIFGLFNVSRPEELTEQFALTSEWSEWSQPVGLDSLVRYFVYGWRPNANSVNFEVFKWENGVWQSEIFQNLQPGDMIGGTRVKYNQEVDFTTGVTVVDIREDARRETFVLLVDSQGNLLTRSFRQDQNSSELRNLRDRVKQDAATLQQNPAAAVR